MEATSPLTSLRETDEIEEKKEWRMCPRCPYRLVDLVNSERRDKKQVDNARDELAKMGFLSAEEKEILIHDEATIERSGSVTPTQRTFTPREPAIATFPPISKNKMTMLPRDVDDGAVLRAPKRRLPKPKQGSMSPERKAPRNPCEETGCQSSHFSDDSSDEEALKGDGTAAEEEESPSKMLKKTMNTFRKRVVRAFSGSDAAARVRSASEVEREGDAGELERFMSAGSGEGREDRELSREMARIGAELERRVALEGKGCEKRGCAGGGCRGHQRGGEGKPGGSCEF